MHHEEQMECAMKTLRLAVAGLCAALMSGPATASADVVLEWNEIMVAVVAEQPAPNVSRLATITHLAVFDAVNAVMGDHQSHLRTITLSPRVSADAAAIAAAHAVLRHYVPDRATVLDAARERSLGRLPDGPPKAGGITVGETTAARAIAARANDGSEPPGFFLPSSSNPGKWQLTPGCPPTGGVLLHWRNVTPFALRRADQFRSEPPPPLTSSRYARDYREIQEVGGRRSTKRPIDRAHVVKVYAALGGVSLWNSIARQIAAAHRRSLTENARTFALLNMAMTDALVAVMDTKYHYVFWRPETAIAAGATDGNDRTDPDGSFVPFIPAPCHPSYPSGHGSTSYAAREVLERTFGRRGHSIIVSTPAVPDVVLQYTRLRDITSDIDDARVYGGIHFRFDQDEGAEQGRRVGAYVYRHSLRPVRRCRWEDDEYEKAGATRER
jgi:hypothetical protein